MTITTVSEQAGQRRMVLRSDTAVFGPGAASPREARLFLSRALAAWSIAVPEMADVVLSELTTNALLHARTSFSVTVSEREGVLRLAVQDGSPKRPSYVQKEASSLSGRGLGLVDSLSIAWGCSPVPGGKEVWADIALS